MREGLTMLQVTTWGTRGGVPVSGGGVARYGGATTCIEVVCGTGDRESGGHRVILDAGTGLVELGRQWGPRARQALFLQSHFHWDHVQGIPFFGPFYDPNARFEFWAARRDDRRFADFLGAHMAPPSFPIRPTDLPCTLSFDDLPLVGQRRIGALAISWIDGSHPSGASCFRLDYQGASVVFTSDTEVRRGGAAALVAHAQDADILVMDAQYFPEEYARHEGFGHSTVEDAVEIALAAGVRELVLTHHDAAHNDARVDAKQVLARRMAGGRLRVSCAWDGACFEAGVERRDRGERMWL